MLLLIFFLVLQGYNTKQNKQTNKNNIIYIRIHMFGEGTDWENNKKPYFPLTGDFVLDNGGRMNSARQLIHGTLDSMIEDARTALGNQIVGLQTQ